ncbi:MAG TPA: chemotaxis protein CheW, partial [Burkholderiaceae bacterium]|nr:chemotaxis protein CheW [Burkholderiaceae bacterium]
GVSLVRGVPVPVVDAATLFGVAGDAPRRLVVLRLDDNRRAALAVDSVIGVRELMPEAFCTVPFLLQEAVDELVAAMTVLDTGLLLVLRTARLIPEAVWQALDTA